jgi:Uncharacterized protein conserved in bacteria
MGQEIERKFLVNSDKFKQLAKGIHYRQGYMSRTDKGVVRVRIAGDKGYLTIKGKKSGISRLEYEYEIPVADAVEMLDKLCMKPDIEKYRYHVGFDGFTWEVDEFLGANAGLVVAEIELPEEDTPFTKPDWIGAEVSHDARYFNSNLIKHPYSEW